MLNACSSLSGGIRNADAMTIAKIILGTFKYEPHFTDIEPLKKVLEQFIGDDLSIPAFLDRRGGDST